MTQLTQAIASNRLQGDEYRSLWENVPVFMRLVQESMGVTQGEMKKLSKEGKITAQVIVDALANAAEIADTKFAAMDVTIDSASERMESSFIRVVGAIDEMTGASESAVEWIINLSKQMDDWDVQSNGTIALLLEVVDVLSSWVSALDEITSMSFAGINGGLQQLAGMLLALPLQYLVSISKALGDLKTNLINIVEIGNRFGVIPRTLGETESKMLALAQAIATSEKAISEFGKEQAALTLPSKLLAEQMAAERRQVALLAAEYKNLKEQIAFEAETADAREAIRKRAKALEQEMLALADGVKSWRDYGEGVAKAMADAERAARPAVKTAAEIAKAARAVKKAQEELYKASRRNMSIFMEESKKEALAWGNVALEVHKTTVEVYKLDQAVDALHKENPEGIFGDTPKIIAEELEKTIDAFDRWSDVFHKLGTEWGDLVASLIGGLSQVLDLAGQLKASGGTASLGQLLGVAAIGGSVGGRIGALAGGQQGTGSQAGSAAGGLAGGLIGGSSAVASTTIGATISAALGTGALPIIGTFIGSAIGSFIGSLFGGGDGKSPEISIGGFGTTTGQVAGTMSVGAFGGFGIRDPRGRDDVELFRKVAEMISLTQKQMAAFLSAEQIAAVTLAMTDFEITMDSDEQGEFNKAIGAFLKESLKAISEDFGDIFDELTIGLSIDPAVMGQYAVGILAINSSLERLGHTVSIEFINAMGGVEDAMSGLGAFFTNLFTPEELLGMQLEDLKKIVSAQFGDIMDEFGIAIDGSNFREIFMAVKDSLSGEDLARWIKLGNTLGLIDQTLDSINDIDLANIDAANSAEQTRVDLILDEAAAIDAMAAAMERELQIRLALNDSVLGWLDINAAFDGALQRNIDTFRIARHDFISALGTWDRTTDGLRQMESAARDFQRAAMAVFNDIQKLFGLRAGTQGFLDQIQMAGMSTEERYDFLIGRGQAAATAAAITDDPGEAAQLIGDAINYAQQAWNLLTTDQQAAMGGDMTSYIQGLLGLADSTAADWEQYLRDQGNDLGDLAESPLLASANIIETAAFVMRTAADVMEGAANLSEESAEKYLDAARTAKAAADIIYQAAIGNGAGVVNAA